MSQGPIRFGFMGGFDGYDDPEFDRVSEEIGVDALAVGESPTQFADPYIRMAVTAQRTTRPLLGTVMTCPGLRHPAVLANTYMELQRLSKGRMFCGIGTGDIALLQMGLKPYKSDEFVAYADAVKRLMAGEEVDWKGNAVKMRTPPVDEQRVPVWFGADGPRGIRAAGRIADGILVGTVNNGDVARTVLDRAAAGAQEAGRSIDDLDVWFMLRVLVTDKENGAIDIDKLDAYATRGLRYMWRTSGRPERENFAAAVLERKGMVIDEDIVDRLYEFNQRWNDAEAHTGKANVRLMDDLGLRDFAGRYWYMSGPPDHVAECVRGLIDAGARNFFAPFVYGGQNEQARQIGEILNRFR